MSRELSNTVNALANLELRAGKSGSVARLLRNSVVVAIGLWVGLLGSAVDSADDLRIAFVTPPDSAKAWCYWWWLNGAASKEGITRDFAEMKKQGIAGALLFDAGTAGADAPRGPAFMSPAWRELYKHAVAEADRFGIALGVNLCSGWNCGGPWVTPEHAAKRLVAQSAIVKGPGSVSTALPRPTAVQDYYRDIAVLAAPVPDDAMPQYELVASSQYQNYGPTLAEDGDAQTRWVSNGDKAGMGPTPEKPEYLQFNFATIWPAAGVLLKAYSDCGPKEVEIQCSDDGQAFRKLAVATLTPGEERIVGFDETRTKHVRVLFLSSQPYQGGNWNVQVAEILVMSKDQVASKEPPRRFVWNGAQALDVTKHMNPEGQLKWDVPQGTWRVLRVGCTLHGNPIKCVGSGPEGPEIDTMSVEAMDAHFAETGAKLIADAGQLAGKSLQYFHIDSWELGQPTWTPKMREEFQRRRGYDPLPWLPLLLSLSGGHDLRAKRFVEDYRRTAADLVAANYYGRLRELSLKGGLRGTHPESGGPFFEHWIDALQCEGINDVPMGEFWKRNSEPDGPITWPPQTNPTVKQIASAAHIYGKPVCQAEAYTSFACDWIDDPWTMKDIGDEAFCHGLTRNVLCFWVHQSRLDAKPGFQWAHVGTHFDCNLTWWPMSSGWLTYLARCQHMLRQGLFVADFAYLQDEAIPSFIAPRDKQQPLRPAGFDYDVINAEALVNRCSAKDGRLVLPDGMSYRYLVLPHDPNAILSSATLKKVDELAEAGVAVVGPINYACAVKGMRETALDALTKADGLTPDIEFRNLPKGAKLDWIHRRDGGADIYFISNQNANDITAQAVLRVSGKQPELWDAVTGDVRDLPQWREEDGRTVLPMRFAPRQSWFVVLRRDAQPPTADGAGKGENFPDLKRVQEIAGAWNVQFDSQWFHPDDGSRGTLRFERLTDWSKRPEEAVKFYSGIATYRTSFNSAIQNPQRGVFLDLGTVKNVARVRLNSRDLGVVWTSPWQVEITNALKSGENELEIEVANLWPNRMIGDATLPPGKRHTITNVRTFDTMTSGAYGCKVCEQRKATGKPAELLPSGLLGPVTLQAVTSP